MLSPQTTAVRSAMHLLSTTRLAASAPGGDFVRLRDVHKSYGPNLVVMDGMSLDMRADDRLVIIGPSGSGRARCCA